MATKRRNSYSAGMTGSPKVAATKGGVTKGGQPRGEMGKHKGPSAGSSPEPALRSRPSSNNKDTTQTGRTKGGLQSNFGKSKPVGTNSSGFPGTDWSEHAPAPKLRSGNSGGAAGYSGNSADMYGLKTPKTKGGVASNRGKSKPES